MSIFQLKSVLSLILLTICFTNFSNAQAVQWKKIIGGSKNDFVFGSPQTMGGGLVLNSTSNSSNGDFSQNNGEYDMGIINFDFSGNLLWAKNYGGTQFEYGRGIVQMPDSGFVITGPAWSKNGDFSPNKGENDIGVLRTDKNGMKLWSKNFGGSLEDYPGAGAIQITQDGGLIILGTTKSSNGDFPSNKGNEDFALIKLDGSGNKLWSRNYGGSEVDEGYYVQQTQDGGLILVGTTRSKNGDFKTNRGLNDIGVIKTDANGVVIWSKTYGGSKDDQGFSIQQTTDGGYIIAGWSNSNNGDYTQINGDYDYSIIKIDANGNKLWSKNLGGSRPDGAYAIKQTSDGGYIIVGSTESNNGDFTQNYGGSDIGVIKIDSVGMVEWSGNYGGTLTDYGTGIQLTPDAGYLLVGYGWSSDGDFSQNHGESDIAVIKLCGKLNPVITGDPGFCKEGSTLLTVSNEFSSYLWSVGGNQRSVEISAPGTISVTVTDGACIDSVTVEVTELPAPSLKIEGETEFCEGEGTELIASGSFDSCIWNDGNTNKNIWVNAPGTYMVTVTDSTLCTAVDSVMITQFEAPDPVIVGDLSFCQGDSTILTTSEVYSDYFWGDSTQTSPFITVKSQGQYIVTVRDQNLCMGMDTVFVNENLNPVPEIIGDFVFCANGSSTLTTQNAYSSYFWTGGDTMSTVTYHIPGEYGVTVTDSNGCQGSALVNITQFSPLDTSVVQQGDTLIALAVNVGYQWIDCDHNIELDNADQKEFIPVSSGNYAVILTDANACRDTSDCHFIVLSSISDKTQPDIKVYPNPSSGKIYIISEGVSIIEVCDLSGKILENQKIEDKGQLILNKGMYILRITSSSGRKIFKVVISD